jgi:thioredoxin 1
MITCNDNDIETRINNSELAVVQFSASWCMPCKLLKPKIEKIEAETAGVTFIYCDIEATSDFSQKMGIMSVPTVIAFHVRAEIDRVVSNDENSVRNLIANLLSRVKR